MINQNSVNYQYFETKSLENISCFKNSMVNLINNSLRLKENQNDGRSAKKHSKYIKKNSFGIVSYGLIRKMDYNFDPADYNDDFIFSSMKETLLIRGKDLE